MSIPVAFRGNCNCGRWLYIPDGHKVQCDCGVEHVFVGFNHTTSGKSNPALSLSAIATYTRVQKEVLDIVRHHPRNTETITWGVQYVHGRMLDNNDVLIILLELQEIGAVKTSFTLGEYTYWTLARVGAADISPEIITEV